MEQTQSYHVFSKVIHWITALIILGLLFIGFYMVALDFSESKLSLYGWHKSFGLLILLLVAVRIIWGLVKRKPRPLDTHKKWEHVLAKVAHIFLYFALFAMPISGWVMSSAGDFTVKFFGVNVPDLMQKNEGVFNTSRYVHEILSFLLLAVIGAHMLGALKHHFIDKDNTLRRMTVPGLGVSGGFVLTVAIMLMYASGGFYALKYLNKKYFSVSGAEESNVRVVSDSSVKISSELTEWHIDFDNSSVGFGATQYGQEFQGNFKIAKGQIFFDENNLADSKVRIEIDISSIKTGSSDRDTQAVSGEWFDAGSHPYAVFESDDFKKVDSNQFIASGDLTLRGVTLPIELPFTLDITMNDRDENIAEMSANIELNRLDFGIGQGKWQSTDAIGGIVKLDISLSATTKQ
ncbi:MAG: cytochrome b/b6 domain-containing protein [Alphaproteobacteria bacterium]